MSDFVALKRGRTAISGGLHVVFDVVLAVFILVVTAVSGTWVFGAGLVVLSKWRMIAVRPRYWLLNIKSNLVDIIVGLGVVLLIYHAGLNIGADAWVLGIAGMELTMAHAFWTVIYMVWLIWLKHQTSELMTEAQALVAVFVGMSAVGLVLGGVDVIFMVVAGFVIGYGAMRHVLVQSEDYDFTLMTFVMGLILAEITWALYHWTIILSYGRTQIVIPQVAVIATLAIFAVGKVYKAAVRHDGKIRPRDVWKTVVFSVILMVLMLVWFSDPIKNLAR